MTKSPSETSSEVSSPPTPTVVTFNPPSQPTPPPAPTETSVKKKNNKFNLGERQKQNETAPKKPPAAKKTPVVKKPAQPPAQPPAQVIPAESTEGVAKYDYSFLLQIVRREVDVPADVQRNKLEQHLRDEEFETAMKMTKEKFAALKGWKRKQVKQRAKLF